ncbi:MAG: T9SS type A sorting domain-containing protein [Saprospiraceae bacterium]|nr:T9SS type A sorting domain-containing protein [Saprospiraceae bacterium]MCB9323970.1 T9SS type A sorting domain-containing protein [Lewinellaceae bacterium]
MKKYYTGKFFLLSLLSFFISFDASLAQTTSLFFENQDVEPGTMVDVDLKVSAFQDMLGMQFSVNWDPNVLDFQNVENFGIDDITKEANFGLDSVGAGRLGFLWIDNSLSGVALVDSSVLFSIKFIVIGDPNSATSVSFSNIPTLIELSDENGVIESEMVSGTLNVTEPNATFFNNAPDQIKVIDCYPNPFSAFTTLDFEMAHGNQLTLSIKDAKGKVVQERHEYFPAGKHKIILNKDSFPSAGIYFYELVSREFKVSQKIIHISN